MREQTELQSRVDSLAAKLKAAGRNFSRLSDDLQQEAPVINVSKEAVEKMVSELWIDIANDKNAAADPEEESVTTWADLAEAKGAR
jgi:hypothetical protein